MDRFELVLPRQAYERLDWIECRPGGEVDRVYFGAARCPICGIWHWTALTHPCQRVQLPLPGVFGVDANKVI